MRTIAKLFGKSPFSPLQTHMEKVSFCIEKLSELLDAFMKQKFDDVEALSSKISELEHEADLTKNDIRNHLPKSLFMPIDRSQFLEILSLQDSLADKAEEIGNLIVLKPLESLSYIQQPLQKLLKKNMDAFWDAHRIINEIDELLESSFGGLEAEKVKEMVEKTAYKEYESDLLQRETLKAFFHEADALPPSSFYIWVRLIEEIGTISHLSEKLANRIRMILEIK